MTLLEAALDLHQAALAVVPVAVDGTKKPAVPWKAYQAARPSEDQLRSWFANGTYDGLGVLTGLTSGNLEMLEVEGRALHLVDQLKQLMTDNGQGEVWARLCAGYLEQSPSGGLHWLYRVDGAASNGSGVARPNTKLGRRPATAEELEADPDDRIKVLIETRGEGGFTVTAPSAGRSHATGQPWRLLAGRPATIPNVTVEERDALYAIAGMLDQMPAAVVPAPAQRSNGISDQDRPGDAYNERATWDDILTPHGWTRGRQLGGSATWVRPGKNARDGISATTGRTLATDGVDRLYVFSSSTEFETETPYTKFAAYTLLEHSGDYAAAARRLVADGYGTPREPAPVLTIAPEPAPPQPVVDGNLATVTVLRPHPPIGATGTVGDSEDAHAHRLITTHGDLIRYCTERGRWLVWDGGRWVWQPPSGGRVREHAKTVARALTDRDMPVAQRRKALSSAGITGCLKQAETDARVIVGVAQLDADPWILNTPAGPVDLRTGQLRAPDPTSLCTKTTTCPPITTFGGEPDPTWSRFLDDTFGTDPDGLTMRDYVQRLAGLTLVGQVREQLLVFLHGPGSNGKSTLVKALQKALGTSEAGYAIAASSEMLMVRKHSEHPAEIAKLAGARMVACSELDDSQRFHEARLKDLTGGDLLDARFLYGQPFTFAPTHTMWLYGNNRPQAHTGGPAFWRRVKLLEFRNVVPVESRDAGLDDKLAAAASTVLAWAIAGAVDYLEHGLREPSSVVSATAAYAADQDTVGRFVADSCHCTSQVRVSKSELRAAYEAWCREVGEVPVTPKRLGHELHNRFGVADAKSNGRHLYAGICLLKIEQAEPTLELAPEPVTEPTALPGLA